MQEQKFKAKEKKVNRMTRSGLVEENLATKGSRKLTDKQEELSLKKSDAEQSFAADREKRKKTILPKWRKMQKNRRRAVIRMTEGKNPVNQRRQSGNGRQGTGGVTITRNG